MDKGKGKGEGKWYVWGIGKGKGEWEGEVEGEWAGEVKGGWGLEWERGVERGRLIMKKGSWQLGGVARYFWGTTGYQTSIFCIVRGTF